MRLLLKEDVDNLGSVGDEVVVKDGYARNYLLPQGKALLANPKNVKAFNHQKAVVQRKLKKVIAGAEEIAGKIKQASCAVTKKVGETGKLYGSVTSQEIAELLKKQGVEIDKRKIQLSEPIKTLGDHLVPIKLHAQVVAEVKVTVEKEAEPEAPAEEAEAPAETAESAEESK